MIIVPESASDHSLMDIGFETKEIVEVAWFAVYAFCKMMFTDSNGQQQKNTEKAPTGQIRLGLEIVI